MAAYFARGDFDDYHATWGVYIHGAGQATPYVHTAIPGTEPAFFWLTKTIPQALRPCALDAETAHIFVFRCGDIAGTWKEPDEISCEATHVQPIGKLRIRDGAIQVDADDHADAEQALQALQALKNEIRIKVGQFTQLGNEAITFCTDPINIARDGIMSVANLVNNWQV